MHTDFDDFVERCHEALTEQSHGNSGPLLSLWSRADDVVFLAPMGGRQLGYEQVSGLLSVVATTLNYQGWHAENLLTIVSDDTAITVEIEHITRPSGSVPESSWPDEIVLRVTTFYRRENGEWRIVVRHANGYEELDFPPYTSQAAS